MDRPAVERPPGPRKQASEIAWRRHDRWSVHPFDGKPHIAKSFECRAPSLLDIAGTERFTHWRCVDEAQEPLGPPIDAVTIAVAVLSANIDRRPLRQSALRNQGIELGTIVAGEEDRVPREPGSSSPGNGGPCYRRQRWLGAMSLGNRSCKLRPEHPSRQRR